MKPLTIIGLSGSLRQRSYHSALLRLAADLTPANVELRAGSITEFPLFNFDIQQQGMPGPVIELGEQIAKADGIFIAAPEYNGTISAPLKNAIDWLSRLNPPLFHNKPVAIVSASPGRLGGMRMQADLRKCLGLLGAHVLPRPELFIPSVSAALDEQGGVLDQALPETLAQLLAAFAEWIAAMDRAFGTSARQ